MIQSQPTGYTRANSFFAPYVPAPPPAVVQRLAESNRIGLASNKTAPKQTRRRTRANRSSELER